MADKEKPDIKAPGWTIFKILNWTQSYFKKHAVESSRLTAEVLLAHTLKIKRLDLYLQYDRPLEQQELSRFKTLIRRRIQNEPVAYITGRKGFFESEFNVTPQVLIPRPDTEVIVEQALAALNEAAEGQAPKKVLELGTGSGAIIISLAKAAPQHMYFATDISVPAIQVAHGNAGAISPVPIAFCAGSWLSMFAGHHLFDLIVSNPPYIPGSDIESLAPDIYRFEPRLALDGGVDGFDCYRIIIEEAAGFLSPGGRLLLEIGYDQKPGICRILSDLTSYQTPEFIKDLSGHDRVVSIKKQID